MTRGRKRVENPATARRILAAAEEHFAAQGMAGARTDEIAAAAHANKAMLYYYFGNKRRLHQRSTREPVSAASQRLCAFEEQRFSAGKASRVHCWAISIF